MRAAILLILFTSALSLFAQDKVTATFSNASFPEVAKTIEDQTPLRLFYDARLLDTLRISLTANELPAVELLTAVFAGSEFNFSQDEQRNIYITWRRAIVTSLPAGLLPGANGGRDQETAVDASLFDKKVRERDANKDRVYVIGKPTRKLSGQAVVTGYVRDARTGEPMAGAAVFIKDPLIGTTTDPLGQYTIKLPRGRRVLTIQSLGMKQEERILMLYDNGSINVEMIEEVTSLKDVVISADRDRAVQGLQMGKEKLDIKAMKQLPMALGETDVIKTVLALPGVQTVGEGAGGINVRGGASNQNLILYNGATVYNSSHLFGFFSTFNPDVVKGLELYKSGLEADKGGRLSSVIDVTAREGNLKKFTATGGLSPVTGRLTLEGPLVKDRTSLLIAGRSTYSDWILKQLKTPGFNKSTASFYDGNINIGHKINDNNQLSLSAYTSRDQFRLKSDTLYRYSDQNASIRWSHRFRQRNFADVGGSVSRYDFSMSSDGNPVSAFDFRYSIIHSQVRTSVSMILNDRHTLSAGAQANFYVLDPGTYSGIGEQSVVKTEKLQQERGMEHALFLGDNFEVSNKLSIYAGLRYSFYALTGKRDVIQYAGGQPIEVVSMVDTVSYTGGIIKWYQGLEPRVNLRYLLSSNTSLKFSLGRTRQYLQMLSNNTAIAPTDVWKLSDRYIRPQVADQASAGWFGNIRGRYELSVEAYYKFLHTATDFQNGAQLFRNPHLETEVLNARGRSYGVELLVRKTSGRLNGWFSYTWSRSFLQTVGPYEIEKVNLNKWYPSNFDKPHAVNVIANYKFNRRVNFSWNLTYSTGRPITLPLARYSLGGGGRLEYSDRNAFRIPDYFRTDLSLNFEGSHKLKKAAHSSWSLGIYNLTGRRNAYSVFFRSEGQQIKGYKLSVFGQAIPTLTWNFRI